MLLALPCLVPHFVTLPKQVSNIMLGVSSTINPDAQQHIILLRVQGIVSLSTCAKYMYRHELERKTSGHSFCLCRHDVTRLSVIAKRVKKFIQSYLFSLRSISPHYSYANSYKMEGNTFHLEMEHFLDTKHCWALSTHQHFSLTFPGSEWLCPVHRCDNWGPERLSN